MLERQRERATSGLLKCIGRVLEDYAVIYLGPFLFKITRLLIIALMAVHLFACIFLRIKRDFSSPEDVEAFYQARNVPDNVSCCSSKRCDATFSDRRKIR